MRYVPMSSRVLEDSPNAQLDKTILERYRNLPLKENVVQATYVWIDGTGQDLRCKDRTLDFVPSDPKGKRDKH
ncbi:glutamine synthetase 2 cytoplasmic-like isoform X1 [Ceratitis capitata]|uniref:glutamine synthetase 2 cytoplasmic-like isoform X1 n=2 Tax=Ceratitis capitata TaxID=7213 RepID=UPI000C6C8601|nr:glutamine synthetase 2 cytoplasmic-like isoform X1 [Ceratitis capitata]